MPSVSIACPSCKTTLKLRGEPKPGTSATCPKCDALIQFDDSKVITPAARETQSHTKGPGAAQHPTVDIDAPRAARSVDSFDFLAPAQQADELGRLGPYRVLGQLGAGGMGMVFRAEDPALRRQLALKVMLPQFAASATARSRFLREARTQAAVEHEHIAVIHQVGEERGMPFIAMPLLKGQTLSDALKQNPHPPLSEVLRIGREIAEGLEAAHEANLIHRDIKPSNIWLEGSKRRVKILDFGLARAVDTTNRDPAGVDDDPVTASGAVIGTPSYMSPEQANGESVDARSDLFSLGVVLYQMTTGALPFKTGTTLAMLTSLAIDTPRPPRERNQRVPEGLNDLILNLLEKDAVDRPQSAEEVAQRLERIGEEMTYTSGPMPIIEGPDPWAQIDASAAETLTRAPAARPRPARSRRGPAILAAVGVLLLLGASFAVYQLMFKTPEGTLIVELEGDDVEARFKKGELQLFDKDGKLLYTLRPSERNKTLPAGKYLIAVVGADGLKVDVPEFVIEKNGKAKVRVQIDTTPALAKKPKSKTPIVEKKEPEKKDPVVEKKEPAAPTVATDPHRRAAEMILKNGGTVEVWSRAGSMHVKKREELPNEPFVINDVRCSGIPIPDDDLQAFAGVNYFAVLRMKTAGDADRGIQHLRGLTTHGIDLTGCPITDESVKVFAGWPELQSLQISGTQITDAAVPHLLKMTHLRYLEIHYTKITDAGLKQLAMHPSLRSLLVGGPGVTAQGLAHLKTIRTLQDLRLSNVGDEIIEPLAQMPQLRMVDFSASIRLTDDGARKLQQALPNAVIRYKAIPPTEAEKKAIRWALDQKANIDGGKRTEVPATAFYVHILTMPGNGPKSGAENLRGIRYIGNLHWNGLKNADAEAEHIATLDSLTNLNVGYSDLSAKGLERLTAIRSLMKLSVDSCPSLDDEAMVHIPKFPHLVDLRLCGCPITDAGLEHLGRARSIHRLDLRNCSKITAVGLQDLATMPVLRELPLDNTPLDDSAVPNLKLLTQVRILELRGTKLTAAGIAKLQQALPKCAIFWDGGLVVPGAADPERALAEWIISKGGEVSVTAKSGIKAVKDLPAARFQVTRAVFEPSYTFTDADLERFQMAPALTELGAYKSSVTDEGFEKFSRSACAPWIGRLGFNSDRLTDAGWKHLPRLPALKTISVSYSQVGEAGADVLAKLPPLTMLYAESTRTTDTMLAKWTHHPLQALNLSSTKITDDGLKAIRDMKTLRELHLKNTVVTDAGLAHLRDWTELTHLHLSDTNVTRACLPVLAKFTNLRMINLGSLALTDADVAVLKPLQKLVMLYLTSNRQITDKALDHLLVFPNLQTLYLESTSLTDTGLTTIAKIPTLKLVKLHGTKVTAEGVAALRKALPDCDVQWDSGGVPGAAPTPANRKADFTNSIGMEFMKVPKGTGWLGGGGGKPGEKKVEFKEDFYLGKYEVTQEEWEKVTGLNPSHFSRTGAGKDAVKDIPDAELKRFPVENVSWDDCQLFIKRLNEKEKDSGWVYRLPTSDESEYACRGGPVDKFDSAYHFYFEKPSNTLLPEQANFDFHLNRTCRVGSYKPNMLGLHDMHGNVHELCDDMVTGSDGASKRMFRRGAWSNVSSYCRAAVRDSYVPSFRDSDLGLRLARVPMAPASK